MEEKSQSLHVGIILDGNGRWATQQGKERLEGHAAGAEALRTLLRGCSAIDVCTVTVFAFAIANWNRDHKEVDWLWILFHQFIVESTQEFMDTGTRVIFIGDRAGVPLSVAQSLERLEVASRDNSKLLLQVALNYDGVDEVTRMVQTAIKERVPIEDVTSEYIMSHLDTQADNEPDILVRTGMTKAEEGMAIWRGSGFLPLQSVQSVCVSSEVLWPDFTIEHLKKIISYANPGARLFGGQR